ncbi:restriction endonuclease subunit S [Halomonas sp. IOP_6]|uniref:restriction endonuclease subunit S n=1 Tax=Halomonas sp. IOP_6 TaxID=2876583 RepID=UPI001E4D24A3|nr:restriction endonuclease subunit S [Halomonas sp. IOP_6]MCD6006177.1 restriction endonuclease subunit S [Halomonas sp. IOP_6]
MNHPPKQTCLLQSIAAIQPGYPFRGKLELDSQGDAFVVQYRHLIVGEPLNDQQGKTLDRVTLPGRKRPEYLCSGDILFMAKGTRNGAAVVRQLPHNTVCTPNFYHIRLTSSACSVMPEFLAWQLNHVAAQRYFAMCSQGSAAPSITKSQLGNLPIVVPPIEQQALMVKLADAATREQQLLNQLIENRQRMIDAAGHQLLRPDTTTGK